MLRLTRRNLLLILCSGNCVGSISWAAEPTPTEESTLTLAEIVVTAEKRAESAQSTPIPLSVVTGDTLQSEGKTTLTDVLQDVAGVQVSSQQTGPQFVIRGASNNISPTYASSPTAVYVDGVYFDRPEAQRGGFYDLQRAEVLLGPQGTLYGFNSVGGSVNLITNDPLIGKTEGYALAEAGNYSLLHGEAAVNIPVNDMFAMRAAIFAINRDGYLSNGQDDDVTTSGRLKALYQPTETFRLLLATEYTKIGGAGQGNITYATSEGRIDQLSNPWYSSTSTPNVNQVDVYKVYANLNWDLDFGTVTWLPAYSGGSTRRDGYAFGNNHQILTNHEPLISSELRLASPSSSKVTWTAGLYYLDKNNPSTTQVDNPAFLQQNTIADVDYYKTRSVAPFAQVRYPIVKWLRFTAGARYSHDKNSFAAQVFDQPGDGCVAAGPPPLQCGAVPYNSQSVSSSKVTYKVGVDADVGPNSLLYADVSTGYRAAGFFYNQGALPASLAVSAFDPETLTAYTLGSKNTLLDGKLRLNGDVFYYYFQNYQVNNVVIEGSPPTAFFIQQVNSHRATNSGVELQLDYLMTSDDKVTLGAQYLHTSIGTGLPTTAPPFPGAVALSAYDGYRQNNAPKGVVNLDYSHDWHLPNGGTLTGRGFIHYETDSWANFEEPQGSRQPAYHRSDLSLMYAFPGMTWSMTAYVRNVENTPIMGFFNAAPTGNQVSLAPPRTFGVILRTQF